MKPKHNYKTEDYEIISDVTQGNYVIDEITIPRVDTSVESLLSVNLYQGSSSNYSGDIQDMTYSSLMDIKKKHTEVTETVNHLKEKESSYIHDDQVFP